MTQKDIKLILTILKVEFNPKRKIYCNRMEHIQGLNITSYYEFTDDYSTIAKINKNITDIAIKRVERINRTKQILA